jgi:hypothetical protein
MIGLVLFGMLVMSGPKAGCLSILFTTAIVLCMVGLRREEINRLCPANRIGACGVACQMSRPTTK